MDATSVVTGFAHDGDTVLAATTRGLLASIDGGVNWSVRRGGVFEGIAVGNGSIYTVSGDLLYRDERPVLSGSQIMAVAAGDSAVLVGTESDGVFRSSDGGETWKSANPGLLDLTVLMIAISPGFATDRTVFLGTPSGLYRSRNGGRAWRAIELPMTDPVVQAIAIAPNGTVLVGTESDGLLIGTGGEWTAAPLDGQSVIAVACSADLFTASTERGTSISTDRGQSWQPIEPDRGPALSLTIAGEIVLAGLASGGISATSPRVLA